MKISPLPFTPPPRPASTHQEGTASACGASASLAHRKDIELSQQARQMSCLLDAGSDINPARVQALREAIAAGQLRMDSSRIADSLLASARELLT